MIINQRYRFAFVHVPKTAGTSVSLALKALPGNRTDLARAGTKHETAAEFARAWRRKALPWRRRIHSLDSYTLFGFSRNPWDRFCSGYHYLCRKRESRLDVPRLGTFKDFVQRAYEGDLWLGGLAQLRPQVDFFLGAQDCFGRALIGRYERLGEHMKQIQDNIGFKVSIPHVNRSAHQGRDYRSEYGDSEVEMVARLFHKDIAILGYTFDGARSCWDGLDRIW